MSLHYSLRATKELPKVQGLAYCTHPIHNMDSNAAVIQRGMAIAIPSHPPGCGRFTLAASHNELVLVIQFGAQWAHVCQSQSHSDRLV